MKINSNGMNGGIREFIIPNSYGTYNIILPKKVLKVEIIEDKIIAWGLDESNVYYDVLIMPSNNLIPIGEWEYIDTVISDSTDQYSTNIEMHILRRQ